MPIYFDGALIWADCSKSIYLAFSDLALYNHLVHVGMLLEGRYEKRVEGLWMPYGDIFSEDVSVTYRIMEFGSKMLVITSNDNELVIPVTKELISQLNVLIEMLGRNVNEEDSKTN